MSSCAASVFCHKSYNFLLSYFMPILLTHLVRTLSAKSITHLSSLFTCISCFRSFIILLSRFICTLTAESLAFLLFRFAFVS